MPSLETFFEIVNALNISSDIMLADDIDNAYIAKASLLQERIELLPAEN